MDLHEIVQKNLTPNDFHLHMKNIHIHVRRAVFGNHDLFQKWTNLFAVQECTEEPEYIVSDLNELFELVAEHYIRISFSEALHFFKESIPKTKKQALRAKVKALGSRETVRRRIEPTCSTSSDAVVCPDIYFCGTCNEVCLEEPKSTSEDSIACDSCKIWFHFGCVGIIGTEAFLKRKNSTWKCAKCVSPGNGKGRGKGKKTSLV